MCALLYVVSISIMSELKMKYFITFCIMHMLTFFCACTKLSERSSMLNVEDHVQLQYYHIL